jgi:hypothetical protein
MSGAVVVALDGDLDWADFDIPDSSAPVRLATLRKEPSRARTVLVRFPRGWERPEAGWYSVSEEIVFLAGTLGMSGEVYTTGEWVYVPQGTARSHTVAQTDVLTIARFGGPARWNAGYPSDGTNGSAVLRRALSPAENAVGSPLGAGDAWILRRGSADATWLLEAPAAGGSAHFNAELLALGSRTWAFVPAGAPFPDLEGLCFCRTFDSDD